MEAMIGTANSDTSYMHQLCDKVSLNIFEKSFGAYLNLIEIHLKTLILPSETFDLTNDDGFVPFVVITIRPSPYY
jgi:hypothetical protein